MFKQTLKRQLNIKILFDTNDILNYLQLGTVIPILKELYQYILHDLECFNAKSILLEEDGNPVGHSLIFHDNRDTLYFGHFGVLNHEIHKIDLMIEQIIKYGEEHGYKEIRGPINIPAIIYGWGFMKKGSLTSLFIGKPVNPSVYQERFFEKGFSIKYEENTWEGYMPRINPWKLKNYDFNDYEYFNPRDWNELMQLKDKFIELQLKNLPSSARITPSAEDFFETYADFVFKYGSESMFFFIKDKIKDKIVACGANIPNPFRKDSKGNYNSIVYYTWVVDPEYRRKGLTILMYGATSLLMWKKKIRYSSGSVASDNIANTEVAKALGAVHTRTHFILEYKL
ncbi:MAG: hypothetical protein ACFE8M_01505 [Candidatus Hermodarchaeota archaeon]